MEKQQKKQSADIKKIHYRFPVEKLSQIEKNMWIFQSICILYGQSAHALELSGKRRMQMEIVITAMSITLLIIGYAGILKENPKGNALAVKGFIPSQWNLSDPKTD